jgi:hypothetical protein
MRGSPFELTWGSSVYVRVAAKNDKETSAFSTPSNGAIILTYPSPPTLSIVSSLTAGEQISLSWTKVLYPVDGGTPVADYTIMVSTTNLVGSFTLQKAGIVPTSVTLNNFALGTTYYF